VGLGVPPGGITISSESSQYAIHEIESLLGPSSPAELRALTAKVYVMPSCDADNPVFVYLVVIPRRSFVSPFGQEV
jgi:hypothetical protein